MEDWLMSRTWYQEELAHLPCHTTPRSYPQRNESSDFPMGLCLEIRAWLGLFSQIHSQSPFLESWSEVWMKRRRRRSGDSQTAPSRRFYKDPHHTNTNLKCHVFPKPSQLMMWNRRKPPPGGETGVWISWLEWQQSEHLSSLPHPWTQLGYPTFSILCYP